MQSLPYDRAGDASNLDFVTNPNALMIMVDQLRLQQYWLTFAQQIALDSITPTIAFIRKHSNNFTNLIGVFTYNLNSGTWTDLNFPVEYNAVTPAEISGFGVLAALRSPSGGLLLATPVAK